MDNPSKSACVIKPRGGRFFREASHATKRCVLRGWFQNSSQSYSVLSNQHTWIVTTHQSVSGFVNPAYGDLLSVPWWPTRLSSLPEYKIHVMLGAKIFVASSDKKTVGPETYKFWQMIIRQSGRTGGPDVHWTELAIGWEPHGRRPKNIEFTWFYHGTLWIVH